MIYLEQALYLIVVLGLLIFIHELGHFLAAKFFGVRVEVFSLGFGRRLVGFRRGETEYRIAVIPLGGYVRMAGEMLTEDSAREPDHFSAKPRWQRVVVFLAGPAMNVALALVLWFGLLMAGLPVATRDGGPVIVTAVEDGSPAARAGIVPGDAIEAIDGRELRDLATYAETVALSAGRPLVYRVRRGDRVLEVTLVPAEDPIQGTGDDGIEPGAPVYVGGVASESPAESAGLRSGDRILAVAGQPVRSPESVSRLIRDHAGGPIPLTIERGGRLIELEVTPRVDPDGVPRIGISVTLPMRVVDGVADALRETLAMARRQLSLMYEIVSRLVRLAISPKVLSGPLEIARVTQEYASYGLTGFTVLLAAISFQLGLFNLLPIPVLDGGQILILLAEMTWRRDIPRPVKERLLYAGLVFIMLFAAMVLMLDVYKRFLIETSEPAPPAVSEPAGRDGGVP